MFRQLSPKDAVQNIDCKTREDCSGDLNPQSIPLGQHFAATMPRFHKPVGVKHVSDAVGGEENKDSASQNLFPKGALVHGPLPATNSSSRNVLRQRLIDNWPTCPSNERYVDVTPTIRAAKIPLGHIIATVRLLNDGKSG
jgi:hypothetical protein